MSKFLLNLLLQISKALVNSKIQFLIRKFFIRISGPADLAAHTALAQPVPLASPLSWAEFNLAGPASPLASLPPQAETAPAGPPCPHVGRVFTGIRFPFWFMPFELAASPSSLCQVGPDCQLRPPPPAARARPRRPRIPVTERRSASRLRCFRTFITSPSFPLC